MQDVAILLVPMPNLFWMPFLVENIHVILIFGLTDQNIFQLLVISGKEELVIMNVCSLIQTWETFNYEKRFFSYRIFKLSCCVYYNDKCVYWIRVLN